MYHIYCDESRPEILGKENPYDDFSVIGGVWVDKNEINKLKRGIRRLRDTYNVHGEIKWKNVSPSKVDFYLELVNLFFENDSIRFRCIVMDAEKVDLERFHGSDQELGFYKFYYQLIFHWLHWNNQYSVYLDFKKNKEHDRLTVLKDILNRASMAEVVNLQALESKQSVLIQLADVLMGAVGYKFNSYNTSEAKLKVVEMIEDRIGHEIRSTQKNESKFNVFQIIL